MLTVKKGICITSYLAEEEAVIVQIDLREHVFASQDAVQMFADHIAEIGGLSPGDNIAISVSEIRETDRRVLKYLKHMITNSENGEIIKFLPELDKVAYKVFIMLSGKGLMPADDRVQLYFEYLSDDKAHKESSFFGNQPCEETTEDIPAAGVLFGFRFDDVDNFLSFWAQCGDKSCDKPIIYDGAYYVLFIALKNDGAPADFYRQISFTATEYCGTPIGSSTAAFLREHRNPPNG